MVSDCWIEFCYCFYKGYSLCQGHICFGHFVSGIDSPYCFVKGRILNFVVKSFHLD